MSYFVSSNNDNFKGGFWWSEQGTFPWTPNKNTCATDARFISFSKYEGGPRIGVFCPVFPEFPALSKRSLLCGQKPQFRVFEPSSKDTRYAVPMGLRGSEKNHASRTNDTPGVNQPEHAVRMDPTASGGGGGHAGAAVDLVQQNRAADRHPVHEGPQGTKHTTPPSKNNRCLGFYGLQFFPPRALSCPS